MDWKATKISRGHLNTKNLANYRKQMTPKWMRRLGMMWTGGFILALDVGSRTETYKNQRSPATSLPVSISTH